MLIIIGSLILATQSVTLSSYYQCRLGLRSWTCGGGQICGNNSYPCVDPPNHGKTSKIEKLVVPFAIFILVGAVVCAYSWFSQKQSANRGLDQQTQAAISARNQMRAVYYISSHPSTFINPPVAEQFPPTYAQCMDQTIIK
ncbi:unnamed protein product [Rotaria socialis]|uniref:Transmembrane protein n=1 Tax=Rotaria socialis TaxID=392032 RepID=A0A817XUX3_9BILA|nr:unnamed protein product [Rotaria socialis]